MVYIKSMEANAIETEARFNARTALSHVSTVTLR